MRWLRRASAPLVIFESLWSLVALMVTVPAPLATWLAAVEWLEWDYLPAGAACVAAFLVAWVAQTAVQVHIRLRERRAIDRRIIHLLGEWDQRFGHTHEERPDA